MKETTDDDLEAQLRSEESQMDDERAQRFYDRVRTRIQQYLESKSGAAEKTGEFLLLVPDVFVLLWRLVNDKRVTGKNKVLLGSSVAYYVLPFDFIPEGLVGPVGYIDDLVFGVYVLNQILADTDAEVLREHWPGSGDVLETIQKVLGVADTLVSKDILARIKKMAGGRKR